MKRLVFALLVALAGCQSKSDRHEHGEAPTGIAHQDHSGKHGGSVQMFGDLHTETVFARDGHHQLYLSDATRQPLPAATLEAVSFTVKRAGGEPEKLTLTAAPDGSHWMAAGAPLGDARTMVRLEFVYQGKPQFIDVPVMHPR